MTIIASVKVRDGLILGTDSMTQIWGATAEGGSTLWKHYTNARKLFQLRDFPIGVMTYGAGNIGNRSIEGIVFDFGKTLGQPPPRVTDAAQGLFEYMNTLHADEFGEIEQSERPALGILVAGYSPDEVFPDEYEFVLPRDPDPAEVSPPETLGAVWRGIDSPYTRLAAGIEPALVPALTAKGFTDAELEALLAENRMTVVFDGMPLQDAINYCAYILDTTIGWSTFQWGAQACARPLQMATILEDSGFEWITKPVLSVPP